MLKENPNNGIRELQRSHERFELAVAGSDAGIWDWDILSNELYVSDRLKELLGYTPDEGPTTMDRLWKQVHPDDYPLVRVALEEHLEERTPYSIDLRLQPKSGAYRWFHVRGQARCIRTVRREHRLDGHDHR